MRRTARRPLVRFQQLVAWLVGVCAAVVPVGTRAASPVADLPAPAVSDEFMRGVAIGLHFEGGPSYAPYLWEVATTGATTVSLVFHVWQDGVGSSAVTRGDDTPSDAELGAAIDSARSLGLDVMLFPIIQLRERQAGDWRGVLRPDDRGAWFRSYRELMVGYARLASQHDVAVFSVGSELGSLERFDEEWRAIIADVRAEFGGQVLYSANWDAYFATPFWDAVDQVGLTGYFELAESPGANPTEDALVSAWAPFVEALRTFAAGANRPVLITELGYVSQTGAAHRPWDYTAGGHVDLQAQLELYRAAFRALHDQPWLGGVFFWNWFGDGGSGDDGYTPRQKPAEQVLRYWFGGALSGAR